MSRVRVGTLADLEEGTATKVDVDGVGVAVVRIGEAVYAIADTCSHAEASLSEGDVYPEDCEIECPLHGSTFRVDTGEPQSLPATRPVRVFDVVVDGDEVFVRS